ncbi:MAG TPA: argininosuccinate synthase [Planctomycetota bacterium]|nr:argininosuccinate synthase [Planctomycetota bacterium]
MDKVVLAYSGGLDTSVCVYWLKDKKNLEVIAMAADLGQGEDLKPLEKRAKAAGASKLHIVDVKETFVTDYCWRAVKANAMYEQGYLLATALGRPLIAAEQVRIAKKEGAKYIAHGCTGKGNDQVRFESTVAALAPELKNIAPVREWDLKSRDQEVEYAKKNHIPLPPAKVTQYSYDLNLWGVSIECGVLEDPWAAPPNDAYVMSVPAEEAPDKAEEVELGFEAGVPVTLNGKKLPPVELVMKLNKIAGKHGVGRSDLVEDRLVGIKSREVYECPGGTVIHAGHRALEAITLSRDVILFKEPLSQQYARMIYEGKWFSDLRLALDAFFDHVNEVVTGTVRVKLYKGVATVTGRKSPNSLYSMELATYSEEDRFDHTKSEGFIHVWSLPMRAEGKRRS